MSEKKSKDNFFAALIFWYTCLSAILFQRFITVTTISSRHFRGLEDINKLNANMLNLNICHSSVKNVETNCQELLQNVLAFLM